MVLVERKCTNLDYIIALHTLNVIIIVSCAFLHVAYCIDFLILLSYFIGNVLTIFRYNLDFHCK